MKAKIIIISLLAIFILYLGGHYIIYGSLVRNCIYTEEILSVPDSLTKGKIVVARDAYLVIGDYKPYNCLKNIGDIKREVVGIEPIEGDPFNKDYFIKGRTLEILKKGTSFQVINVIKITKHGISTIDSGPGPIYYLVLKGNDNNLYQIATVMFGINDQDLFLSFIDPSQPTDSSPSTKFLSPNSFEDDKDAFVYSGKLTELSREYLEKIESSRKNKISPK